MIRFRVDTMVLKFAIAGQTRTFTFNFTDRDGNPVNPDAGTKSAKVYDPTNILIATIDDGDFAPISLGVFDVTYTPPETAMEGRWKIVVEGTLESGANIARDTHAFKVVGWQVPEIAEVRQLLGNMSTDRVPDTSVAIAINIAYNRVSMNAGAGTSNMIKEDATLAWACYETYKAYVAEMQKGVGMVPAAVSTILSSCYELAQSYMPAVKRAQEAVTLPINLTETLIDIIEG